MKDIVITEFLEMVEEEHGLQMVEELIKKTNLPSKGVYTSFGNYSHLEIVSLVSALAKETNTTVNALLKKYGNFLFEVFIENYPSFFSHYTHVFDFLQAIDTTIHLEVLKRYPDAELPRMQTTAISASQLEMVYYSPRKMHELAIGLIEKAITYYNQEGKIETTEIEGDGAKVKILITLN